MTASGLLGDLAVYGVRCALLLSVGLALPRLLGITAPRAVLAYWRALLPVVLFLPFVDLPVQLRPVLGGGAEGLLRFGFDGIVVVAGGSRLAGLPPLGVLVAFLAAGSVLSLLRLGIGLLGLSRLVRSSRPVAVPTGFLPALERRVGATASLRVCEAATSPSTFGWLRPVVLLPPAFEEMPEGEQAAILCHELLHVRRRDWLVTLGEETVRACLWFHPAVWLLLSRTALAREQVVDLDVVDRTGARRTYLEALLRIASLPARPQPIPVAALCRGSQLVKRVALLTQEVSMSPLRIASSLAAASLALSVTGAVGAVAVAQAGPGSGAPVPSAAKTEPAASAAELASPPSLADLKARKQGKVTEPVVVSRVQPKYPEEARKAGITGKVVVEATVTTEGAVRNPLIVESPDKALDAPTLEAISQWKYKPATLAGKPVAVLLTITASFKLQ